MVQLQLQAGGGRLSDIAGSPMAEEVLCGAAHLPRQLLSLQGSANEVLALGSA